MVQPSSVLRRHTLPAAYYRDEVDDGYNPDQVNAEHPAHGFERKQQVELGANIRAKAAVAVPE